MADALQALDEMSAKIAGFADTISATRTKYITVAVAQPVVRAASKTYFESVRSELDAVKNRAGLVDEIDFVLQELIRLAAAPQEPNAYRKQIKELRPYLLEATVDLLKASGTPRLVLSETERAILGTLSEMLPSSAASYEQALRDIAQGGRVSWRGTATDLREVLREVLDQLAPDAEVMAAPGFKFEPDLKKPTQKQKVRFILRARRSSSSALTVAEASLNTIDEGVANLARSTYQRGSVSTHVGSSSKEIKNLKRYSDALLAELLEIN